MVQEKGMCQVLIGIFLFLQMSDIFCNFLIIQFPFLI